MILVVFLSVMLHISISWSTVLENSGFSFDYISCLLYLPTIMRGPSLIEALFAAGVCIYSLSVYCSDCKHDSNFGDT